VDKGIDKIIKVCYTYKIDWNLTNKFKKALNWLKPVFADASARQSKVRLRLMTSE